MRRLTAFAAVLASLGGSLPAADPQAPSARFLLTWGKPGAGDGEFHAPIGIAVGRDDEVFVTDVHNGRIQKFTSDGKFLAAIPLPPDSYNKAGGRASQAAGIAVDDAGDIYVSLMAEHKVLVFSKAGELIRQWGKRGQADGEFVQPGGVVIGLDGSIYVADQGNHRVQRFSREGKFLAKWGGYGKEPGQFGGDEPAGSRFAGPHFLARDRRGNIYTTEGVAGRVQKFTADGKPLGAWGDKGDRPGGFGSLKVPYSTHTFGPVGICVDRSDRVWVSSLNNRVQLFTADGKYLTGIGDKPVPLVSPDGKYLRPAGNTETGQFRLPHAMVVDSRGRLYVVDSSNQRIQKFEITEP